MFAYYTVKNFMMFVHCLNNHSYISNILYCNMISFLCTTLILGDDFHLSNDNIIS